MLLLLMNSKSSLTKIFDNKVSIVRHWSKQLKISLIIYSPSSAEDMTTKGRTEKIVPKENSSNHSLKAIFLVEMVGTFILVYAIASAATFYSDSGELGAI